MNILEGGKCHYSLVTGERRDKIVTLSCFLLISLHHYSTIDIIVNILEFVCQDVKSRKSAHIIILNDVGS